MKALKLMLVSVFFLASLVACASGNNASEPPKNTDTPKTTTPTPPAEEKKDPPPAQPDPNAAKFDLKGETIKIGLWWEGADPRTVPEADRNVGVEEQIKLIEAAEKKYNTKIEFVKFADYEKYVENFTTTSLAGEPFADIVVLELFWAFPQLVNKGFIAPIDEWIDMKDPKYNNWMKTGGSFNGKQYGFYDSAPSPYGMFYNKTLVQEMGLEDPYELQQKGEWTWDKFRELTKKATKDTNGDGKVDVYGFAGSYGKMNAVTEQFIYTNKGSVDRDEKGDLNFSLGNKNALDALQFVSDLYNVDKSIMQPVPEDATKEFISGKGVIYAGFSWELGGLVEKMPDKTLGWVFFPKAPNATDYMSYTPFGNMYMVAKHSKNAEAAIHIFDEINLHEKGREITFQAWETSFPTKEMLDTRKQMYDKIGYLGGYYAIPDSGKLFGTVVTDITEGKVTPATAVEKVKSQFEANLKKLQEDSKQ
ncbi:ABC transporter substrate-binding protein [Paenibacillus marinisediminis]